MTNTSQQDTRGQPPSLHQEVPCAELTRPRPFNQVLKNIEDAPTGWNYRSEGEPLLKLQLTPEERKSALSCLRNSANRASIPVPEREVLSRNLPAPVYDAFKAYIAANDAAWCPEIARIVQGIEEGLLTARQIAVTRRVIRQEAWAASSQIEIPPGDPSTVTAEDVELQFNLQFRRMYPDSRVSQAIFQGYAAGLALWEDLRRLAPLATDDYEQRTALLERIIRDTSRSLLSPDKMSASLGGLAVNTKVLGPLTGFPVPPCAEATTLIPEKEIASTPPSEILNRIIEDVGVFNSRGGRPSTFDIGAPLVVRHDGVRRMLSPDIEAEKHILRGMLVIYIEELIHAQQILQAEKRCADAAREGNDSERDRMQDSLLCPLSAQYVVAEERLKRYARPSDLDNQAGECDAALRMLQIFTEEGIPLEYLNAVLFEYHQEVREDFLAWVSEKGIALPPRPQ